jgi:uncharacterized membrane-anchored protein
MRKALAAAAAGVVCMTILAGMLVSHAYPLWVGQEIVLRVVQPIDPRDLFRGDYVILSYRISQLQLGDEPQPEVTETDAPVEDAQPSDAAAPTDDLTRPPIVRVIGDWLSALDEPGDRYDTMQEMRDALRGKVLYIQLEAHASEVSQVGAVYEAVSVSDTPVDGAMNLQARVRDVTRGRWDRQAARWLDTTAPLVALNYGLEAMYVKEGSGLAVEDAMRHAEAMHAIVALAPNGKARLKNLLIDGKPVLKAAE